MHYVCSDGGAMIAEFMGMLVRSGLLQLLLIESMRALTVCDANKLLISEFNLSFRFQCISPYQQIVD